MSRSQRQPARIEDKPTVMTAEDVCDVTRMGREALSERVGAGEIRPLSYSRNPLYFWQPEVIRFLAASTGVTIVGDPYARILELERRLSECAS